MPNLKEVRTRIASVKSTQQITSAMKMVAASKLRRAQNAILKLRPYANKMNEILKNLNSSLENGDDSPYSQTREPRKVLLVVIASNRGMCGAFNSNIIKLTNILINEKYAGLSHSGNLDLICIGRKASEFYKKKNIKVIAVLDQLFDNLTFDNVAPVAEQLMKYFTTGEYDRIELVYNQFKNAAVQRLINEQYLPIAHAEPVAELKTNGKADYIFEPSKKEIVEQLIPKSLKIQLYKALLDSFASEQGARMTAMHQATDNASDLLKSLTIAYNNARQTAITNEILEIVSGANALKKN
jgi:F-type H+-transporting ATPase subunit gamma